MNGFATINDLRILWRELNTNEIERATELIKVVSDHIRLEAVKSNKDIDTMISESVSYANVVKTVVVDVVARTLMTSTDKEPMTQESQSALGYTWSGTFLIPGGGLFIKDSEFKKLGLKKQRYGVIDFYGKD